MGLFSGLGKLIGKVANVASTIAPFTSMVPGPIGAVSRGVSLLGGVVGGGGTRAASAVGVLRPTPFNPSQMTATRMRLPSRPQATQAGLMDMLPDIGVEGPGVFTAKGCPPGYHLAKDRSGRCVRNRRMNPLNHRANMRAARRLVAFRKAVVRTEKALRKAVPPSARRRAPAGHRARLTHQ